MCEIFGFSGRNSMQLNTVLKDFYDHSDKHPDGWGLAVFHKDSYNIEKESLPAYRSTYLKERLKEPIVSKNVLAHIRLATVGAIARRNSHPYEGKDKSGRHWTMIHNGTIIDFPKLMKYSGVQEGDTDSERVLLYILDEINKEISIKGEDLTEDERFDVLDRIMYEMSEGNKLNLVIYDGELMYVHYNSESSLYYRQGDDSVIVCTKPLKERRFEPFPITQLMAYKEGKLVLRGTIHEHIYIENEEAIKQILLTYAEL